VAALEDPAYVLWRNAVYRGGADTYNRHLYGAQDRHGVGGLESFYIARSWHEGEWLAAECASRRIGQVVWQACSSYDFYTDESQGGRFLWEAIFSLYKKVFEPLGNDRLGHLSEKMGRLGGITYMFWDAATWRPRPPFPTYQTGAFLTICQWALASPKAAVQESALHGLGHAARGMPESAQLCADFARNGGTSRSELRRYAAFAQQGMVQ